MDETDAAEAESSRLPWWAWALIVAVTSLPVCAFIGAFALNAISRYASSAKLDEARLGLSRLTAGIVRCASELDANGAPRGLPPSSNPVPRNLASVSAHQYQSVPADWATEAAFRCAAFSFSDPQYFVYKWQSLSPTDGVATAVADLDGDGAPDHQVEQSVTCSPTEGCRVQPFVER